MPKSNFNYITKIWKEEAEEHDPFATKSSYCAGYNVYQDLLGKASWAEYLFLLFRLEKPAAQQTQLLESLATILANPGMRDHSVLAAMNAGVGGSTSAACLIAALGVGAGQLNGAHEVFLAMQYWEACSRDIQKWSQRIKNPILPEVADIWEPIEHFPGFNPNARQCATIIIDSLEYLSSLSSEESPLYWLWKNRSQLEFITGMPLNFSGVAAACLHELGFTPQQGEMLFLLLRLPGAAVHALEQSEYGWRKFPFYEGCLSLTPTSASVSNDQSNSKEEVNHA